MTERKRYRKQSLYLPGPLIDQVTAEAKRLGKPLSWVCQQCVEKALPLLKKLPGPGEVGLAPSDEE